MTRQCSSCGQEATDLARFCSRCGAVLPGMGDGATDATGTMDVGIGGSGPLSPLAAGGYTGVPTGTAMLIVRRGPSEGTTFQLNPEGTRLGRADDNDVVLDDVTVSRRHAEIEHAVAGWRIRDLGSLNGIYVNLERIESTLLAGGDELQIGKYRFVFLVGGG